VILKGRLFWKILLGFWLAIVLVSQLNEPALKNVLPNPGIA